MRAGPRGGIGGSPELQIPLPQPLHHGLGLLEGGAGVGMRWIGGLWGTRGCHGGGEEGRHILAPRLLGAQRCSSRGAETGTLVRWLGGALRGCWLWGREDG